MQQPSLGELLVSYEKSPARVKQSLLLMRYTWLARLHSVGTWELIIATFS
jgi:hypothetical protein